MDLGRLRGPSGASGFLFKALDAGPGEEGNAADDFDCDRFLIADSPSFLCLDPDQKIHPQKAFALAYILLAIVTTKNVDWLRKQPTPAESNSSFPPGRAFNAVLAALVLSMVVLISNFVWSLVVLLKSTASGSKLAGFAHGSTLASTFHISALMILVGCVLNAFSGGVRSIEESTSAEVDGAKTGVRGWGRNDSDAFNATFVLAFIVAGLHVVLWAMLLTCRSAFVKTVTVAV